jgi:hypothetical protein
VIGNLVRQIEPTEPAIGQMKLDFLAKLSLGADAVAVADNEHPNHQFGIDRRSANVAVERRKFLAQVGQSPRHNRIDPAQQMVNGNVSFEIE